MVNFFHLVSNYTIQKTNKYISWIELSNIWSIYIIFKTNKRYQKMTSNIENKTYQTLGSLMDSGIGREKAYFVQTCWNMGSTTFLMTMPMKAFHEQSIVANPIWERDEHKVAQRPLDEKHAIALAKYLLKGLIRALIRKLYHKRGKFFDKLQEIECSMGETSYISIQPLVCNIRDLEDGGRSLRWEPIKDEITGEQVAQKVYLKQNILFHVVDGQHRREAMNILFNFLNAVIPARNLSHKYAINLLSPHYSGEMDDELVEILYECRQIASEACTVQFEIHLGLDAKEERQLFHDLNNLGKNIDQNITYAFDSANPVGTFIEKTLIPDSSLLKFFVTDKESNDWAHDTPCTISHKEIVSVNARLFLNKTNTNGALPARVHAMEETARKFWGTVGQIPHVGEKGARVKTVAVQPVFLKALAKIVYTLSNGKKVNLNRDRDTLNLLFQRLSEGDFSHSNPLWRYFELSHDERRSFNLEDIAEYLPEDAENKAATKMFSAWDREHGILKYGTAHNDIHPILGDLIRYELKLPPREHRK